MSSLSSFTLGYLAPACCYLAIAQQSTICCFLLHCTLNPHVVSSVMLYRRSCFRSSRACTQQARQESGGQSIPLHCISASIKSVYLPPYHIAPLVSGGLTQDPAEHVHDRLDRKAEASSSNDLDMLQEEEQMVDQLQRHFQQTIRSAPPALS